VKLNWLQKLKWLTYSDILNLATCKFCVIFSKRWRNWKTKYRNLIHKRIFKNWEHAIEKFNNHDETCYHKAGIENYKIMSHKSHVPVIIQLDKLAVVEMIEK